MRGDTIHLKRDLLTEARPKPGAAHSYQSCASISSTRAAGMKTTRSNASRRQFRLQLLPVYRLCPFLIETSQAPGEFRRLRRGGTSASATLQHTAGRLRRCHVPLRVMARLVRIGATVNRRSVGKSPTMASEEACGILTGVMPPRAG
jgi:hypothetical protein